MAALLLFTFSSTMLPLNRQASLPATTVSDENAATPALRIYCDEVARRVPASDCDYYKILSAAAKAGVGAFNVPSPLRRDAETPLELVIAFAPPKPVVEKGATPATASVGTDTTTDVAPRKPPPAPPAPPPAPPPPPGAQPDEKVAPVSTTAAPPTPEETLAPLPGDKVSFQPIVGRFMSATLTGAGFDIKPQSPASQEVLPDSQTIWNWTITARKRGPLTLVLETVVEAVTPDGKHYPLRSTVKNQTVTIQVAWWQALGDDLDAAPTWLKRLTGVLTGLAALIGAGVAVRAAIRKGHAKPT